MPGLTDSVFLDTEKLNAYIASENYTKQVEELAKRLENYTIQALQVESSTSIARKVVIPMNIVVKKRIPMFTKLKTFDIRAELVRLIAGDIAAILLNLGYTVSLEPRVDFSNPTYPYYLSLVIEIPANLASPGGGSEGIGAGDFVVTAAQ